MVEVTRFACLFVLGAAFGGVYWLLMPSDAPVLVTTAGLIGIGAALGFASRRLEWLLWHRAQPKPKPAQFRIRL